MATSATARGPAAVAWSGGKDSLLALDRADRTGERVTHLFNLYEASTGLVRFHGVPRGWIAEQARALRLELIQEAVGEDGFEPAFARALDRLRHARVRRLVFGNIHLADVRAWYETRTRAAGFEHVEPLWGEPPRALLSEFLARGYRTCIVSVNLALGDPRWLGRELDAELAAEIAAEPGRDVCGERGEYHSFAVDGPRFAWPLKPGFLGVREREGHRFMEFEDAVQVGQEGADS